MTKRLLPIAGLAALVISTSCKPNSSSQSMTAEPAAQASAPESSAQASSSEPTDKTASASVASSQQTDTGGQPQGDRPRGNRQGGGNNAPSAADRQQRAAERLQRMKTELALTDDQATKIQAIYTQQMGSMPQQGSNMTREERRAAFAKVREATNAQISQILTPEQKTKFETMQQERRAQAGQGGQGGRQRGEGGGGQGNGGGN